MGREFSLAPSFGAASLFLPYIPFSWGYQLQAIPFSTHHRIFRCCFFTFCQLLTNPLANLLCCNFVSQGSFLTWFVNLWLWVRIYCLPASSRVSAAASGVGSCLWALFSGNAFVFFYLSRWCCYKYSLQLSLFCLLPCLSLRFGAWKWFLLILTFSFFFSIRKYCVRAHCFAFPDRPRILCARLRFLACAPQLAGVPLHKSTLTRYAWALKGSFVLLNVRLPSRAVLWSFRFLHEAIDMVWQSMSHVGGCDLFTAFPCACPSPVVLLSSTFLRRSMCNEFQLFFADWTDFDFIMFGTGGSSRVGRNPSWGGLISSCARFRVMVVRITSQYWPVVCRRLLTLFVWLSWRWGTVRFLCGSRPFSFVQVLCAGFCRFSLLCRRLVSFRSDASCAWSWPRLACFTPMLGGSPAFGDASVDRGTGPPGYVLSSLDIRYSHVNYSAFRACCFYSAWVGGRHFRYTPFFSSIASARVATWTLLKLLVALTFWWPT